MSRRIVLVDIGVGLTLAVLFPSVALGGSYSARLIARGGNAPYTYAITAGALPDGLALDRATGIISGTANAAGAFGFTARVTDITGATVDRAFVILVQAEPLVITGHAPNGTIGTAYSFTYGAVGGTPPYTWQIVAGALPPGLTLNTGTGKISGTPTADGSYTWTLRASDGAGRVFDLDDGASVVYAMLTLSGTYAAGVLGSAYNSDLTINGGGGVFSNPRVTVGTLPSGLALSVVGNKLRLSGTPTAAETKSFTVAVDSGDGQTATSAQNVSITAGTTVSGLHFDGANGSTSFVDVTGKIWTPLGSASISTADSMFGGASGLFAGGNSAISTPYHHDFDILGSAFTLRGWVRQTTTGDRRIFSLGGTQTTWNSTTGLHLLLQVNSARYYSVTVSNGTVAPLGISTTVANVTGAWEHVEVDCDGAGAGAKLRLYVNGVLIGIVSASGIVRPSGDPVPCYGRITSQGPGNDWIGNLDDWQIIKGVALHSGTSFTPPTAPFTYP